MSLTGAFVNKKAMGFTLIELVLTIVLLGFSAMIMIPFFSSITHSPDPVLREKAIALAQAMMDEITAKRWDKNSPNGGNPPICTDESPNVASRPSLDPACTPSPPPDDKKKASAIGLDSGEAAGANNRMLWDDVDDYNGVVEDPDNGHPFYDQNGEPLDPLVDPLDLTGPTLKGFTRKVEVRYIESNPDPDPDDISERDEITDKTTDTKRIVVTVTSPLGETFSLVAVSCNF